MTKDKFETFSDEEIEAEATRRRQEALAASREEALAAYKPILAEVDKVRHAFEELRVLHTPELLALSDGLWGRLKTWLQVTDQLIAKAEQIEADAGQTPSEPSLRPSAD